MNIKEEVKEKVREALKNLQKEGVFDFSEVPDFEVEYPEENFGDYSCNIAMKTAKLFGKNPREIAEMIKEEISKNDKGNAFAKIEVAGPGFLNFYLSDEIFFENVKSILKKGDDYGKNESLKGQKAVVEYTDPNPFKEFHIGHLMPNVIGESISRIIEFSGADVKRVCYQGDVGMQIAKPVWALINNKELFQKSFNESSSLSERMSFLGEAYAFGSQKGDREELKDVNKKIYEKSDEKINEIYQKGRDLSLEYFDTIYKKLGTDSKNTEKAFDEYFFESEVGGFGKELVEKNLEKGVFKESEGAIVFEGEEFGLHTRVFVNSEGLPTYEAKELGLAKIKYDQLKYDKSIIVTGNEVNEYFKVLLKAMSIVYPDLAEKTEHIGHGMLRLPSGKMSSRTGDVVTAVNLLDDIKKHLGEKKKQIQVSDDQNDNEIEEALSIAAIKYTILKQKIGKDIIFDFDRSISFEGDSGVYLAYSYVRTKSVLRRAETEKVKSSLKSISDDVSRLERVLVKFPEVVELALTERSPHVVTTYLIELAQEFNSYYAKNKIVGDEKESPYRVALTEATSIVLKNGLNLLGIKTVEKM